MSGTRATLRLLDDLPMLQYNLQYKLGHEVYNMFQLILQVKDSIYLNGSFI